MIYFLILHISLLFVLFEISLLSLIIFDLQFNMKGISSAFLSKFLNKNISFFIFCFNIFIKLNNSLLLSFIIYSEQNILLILAFISSVTCLYNFNAISFSFSLYVNLK